ncbi:MAG: carboxy terminal-processing peptidase [Bacteroidota bacterium]
MKIKVLFFLAIAGLAVIISGYIPSQANNEEKERFLVKSMISGLKQLHFDPANLDDEFSSAAFDQFMESLDRGKRFFTASDIKALEAYRYKIDEAMISGDMELLDLTIELLDGRVAQTQEFYRDILSKPFDLTINEEIELDSDKIEYASSDEELKGYWEKAMKLRIVSRVHSELEKQKKANEKGEEKDERTFAEIEEEAREKELESNEKWFKRIRQLKRSDRFSAYMNAVTSVYDPHTNYLPPKEKEDFDINFAGRLEGIGARLFSDGEDIKISSIVPGSASWRQGELEVGDVILKVGQGSEEPVDIVGWRTDDAVQLIRGKKGTEVRLTVRKKDGAKTIIPIIRDIVVIEEGYAKSSLLKSDDLEQPIGYIYLPSFYADFTRTGGRNCADDIKNELKKLKAEGAHGIIFDLRGNAGGSLPDVVKMTGHFIEKGPVVQVKSFGGDIDVQADRNPAVEYDGPMVVLVDYGSASASEIMAAALQDYNRAIIIGMPTYGKGTVQRFVDLDRVVPANRSDLKPLGYIKLTTQKFYRIDGRSTQLRGVTPDIVLPNIYQNIDVGEAEYDHAMEWDEIGSASYAILDDLADKAEIIRRSKARVAAQPTFQVIEENAKIFKSERDDTNSSLNLDVYTAEVKEDEAIRERYDDMESEIEGLTIASLQADLPSIELDTVRIAQRDEFHKGLSSDVYLEEAIAVIIDLMNSSAYAADNK